MPVFSLEIREGYTEDIRQSSVEVLVEGLFNR